MSCFRCGRKSHFANNCYAKTTIDGEDIDSETSSESEEDTFRQRKRAAKANSCSTTTYSCAQPRIGVYVLQTDAGMYYVGKSNDIDARIQEHQSGLGAACLRGHRVQNIAKLLSNGNRDDLESWERNETLERMKIYGIDNVRGWMFTSATLSRDDYQKAFDQVCEKFDLCRRCGRASHFADKCFAKSVEKWAARHEGVE